MLSRQHGVRCSIAELLRSVPARTQQWRGRQPSGKNRFNIIRHRAREQHVDYLRQLKAPSPYRKADVDPKAEELHQTTRRNFLYPDLTTQPQPEQLRLAPEVALKPRYEGVPLGGFEVEQFGRLEAWHDDLFNMGAADASTSSSSSSSRPDVVILPIQPNLTPYRGLTLEVMERGGPQLVEDIYTAAKTLMDAEARKVKEKNEGAGDPSSKTGETALAAALDAGHTFLVPQAKGEGQQQFKERYADVPCDRMLFVVVPWFWQGSPLDAAKRFRFCIKSAFTELTSGKYNGIHSVMLPNIGCGVYGYEPHKSSQIIVEEAFEALVQMEKAVPNYNLKKIMFVDSRKETAYDLNEALTEVAHRWLPERRITTAPEYWSHATRRLLLLPAVPNFFLQRSRVKFRKRHGVLKRERHHYIANIRPWTWRAHRVQQPPPLLVYKHGKSTGTTAPVQSPLYPDLSRGSPPRIAVAGGELERLLPPRLEVVGDDAFGPGDASDRRLALDGASSRNERRLLSGRPFFKGGVTHWLFPSRKSGFNSVMRKSSRGQWVGQNKPRM